MKTIHVTIGRDVSEYTRFRVDVSDDQYEELRKTGGLGAFLAQATLKELEDADLFYSFESDTSTAHSLRIKLAEIPGEARVAEDIPLEPDYATAGTELAKALTALKEGYPVRPALTKALCALSVQPERAEKLTQAFVEAAGRPFLP